MIVTVHSNSKDLPRRPNKKMYKQLNYKTIIELSIAIPKNKVAILLQLIAILKKEKIKEDYKLTLS